MEENKDSELSTTCFKLVCIVCGEYLIDTDIIYSSPNCGHVFHKECLLPCVQRSSQCPQCKGYTHEFSVHRLFLNFNEASQDDEEEIEPIRCFEWRYLDKHVTSDEISKYGFQLGTDEEGNPIFAARYWFGRDEIPGYYIPKLKGFRVSRYSDVNFIEEEIQVLDISNDTADYKWVAASNGELPKHALCVGYNDFSDVYYFARSFYENMWRYGYLNPYRRGALVIFGEKEVHNKNYEVLVRISRNKIEKGINFK